MPVKFDLPERQPNGNLEYRLQHLRVWNHGRGLGWRYSLGVTPDINGHWSHRTGCDHSGVRAEKSKDQALEFEEVRAVGY